MSVPKDFVQFGGPGAELTRHGSRGGPGVVFVAKTAEKEGIFSEVIVGGIPVIRILFPVPFSQVGCFWLLFVACHTIMLENRLDETGKTKWIGALDVGLDF